MRINRTNVWPYVHFCCLDIECWHELWLYGAPLRLHYKDKFWNVPVLMWVSDYRWHKLWDHAEPVNVTSPPGALSPTSSRPEGCTSLPNQEDPTAG